MWHFVNLLIFIVLIALAFYVFDWCIAKASLGDPWMTILRVVEALAILIVALALIFGKLPVPTYISVNDTIHPSPPHEFTT